MMLNGAGWWFTPHPKTAYVPASNPKRSPLPRHFKGRRPSHGRQQAKATKRKFVECKSGLPKVPWNRCKSVRIHQDSSRMLSLNFNFTCFGAPALWRLWNLDSHSQEDATGSGKWLNASVFPCWKFNSRCSKFGYPQTQKIAEFVYQTIQFWGIDQFESIWPVLNDYHHLSSGTIAAPKNTAKPQISHSAAARCGGRTVMGQSSFGHQTRVSISFKGGPSKFPALLFWELVGQWEGQFQKYDILRLPDAFQKTVWATLDGYMANTNSTWVFHSFPLLQPAYQ
jgi:hypothetical protein